MTEHSATPKDLRTFGLLFGGMLSLFFGLLIPWIWDFSYPRWPWITWLVLGSVALIYPLALSPLYKVWMRLAEILGWINTRLILGLIFFVLFVPVAFILKLIKRDAMQRSLDRNSASYRVISDQPSIENLDRPF